MSFVVGLVVGIVVGFALIVVFVRSENARSKLRTDLAATVAAFARMTVEDSRQLLGPEYYPSWVVFSQRQKLNWLNSHLTKIWPYVNEASELIKSSVEPTLEQYRPIILSSLKFSKFTLGTVAPQFTGCGVTMELEMNWDGNPNIVLDVKTRLGVSLPVQVKDIGFTGVFRLIFKPLKKFDFKLKVIGGDITSIPGLSGALEVRNYFLGTLSYVDLTNKDFIGKSDPYAELYIRPLRERTKTSKIISNDLNPIWNEHYEFVVEDASTQHLYVKIFDDEGLQASELLGCAQVQLSELEPGKVKDVWLKLVKDLEVQRDNKYRGEVHLELLYCPYGMENSFTNPFAKKVEMTTLERVLKSSGNGIADAALTEREVSQKKREVIVRGVLSVTVISAEDLPVVDLMGKADPFVVLTMKKSDTKNKTRVVNENLNPEWNQTFDFVVEDALHDMLIAEVYDHDTFRKEYIGRCILTLTRVILEGEYRECFTLDGAKSGRLNLSLKWVPQPIYRDSQW
ncbi:unnamed protein product [Linum tenue]|uniref:C2 domain-containing protein n=1 Tax=Linum tenue TaxID=586396 RepID=A0AAV0HW51_9ROSI|nr:unnamed protein product [Linum tenue]